MNEDSGTSLYRGCELSLKANFRDHTLELHVYDSTRVIVSKQCTCMLSLWELHYDFLFTGETISLYSPSIYLG